MLPIVGVPETGKEGLAPYRELFCRDEGFEHISRYVTGLILSPNKTLRGIYDLQVWEGEKPTRRVMHEGVFEAGWDAEGLMPRQRAVVAPDHRGRGREVISLEWTLAHYERGPKIYGTTKSYDYVERRMARFQTVVTGGLWELAKQWSKGSPASKVRGESRESFSRFKELSDEGGEAALPGVRRRKPDVKKRVAPEVEEAGGAMALEQPAWGPVRAAKARAQRGMPSSAAGVRGVWERHGLENLNKRLRALEAKGARESQRLPEAQLAALEKAKGEKDADGACERACPGYGGAQAPFSVGT